MLSKALEKISGAHLEKLKALSAECSHHIKSSSDKWHAMEAERLGGKIRGYLEALEACEIITHRELQGLYLYFKINAKF